MILHLILMWVMFKEPVLSALGVRRISVMEGIETVDPLDRTAGLSCRWEALSPTYPVFKKIDYLNILKILLTVTYCLPLSDNQLS